MNLNPRQRLQPRRCLVRSSGAYTIIEVIFASAIVAIFMGGIALINSNTLTLLRIQREQSSASLCLQQRVEQIRALTFANLISSSYIQGSVMNTGTSEEGNLNSLTETLKVSTYPTNTAYFTVTRNSGTAITTATSGAIVTTQSLVRVDFSFQWTSRSGQQQTRQVSTVVANGGLNSA